MDINATLIGQTIAFLVFVLFCWKFIWPPLSNAINKRQQEIADSIESVNKAREDITKEKNQADIEIEKAKNRAKEIINAAEHQAAQIAEQARAKAVEDTARLKDNAAKEIEIERSRAQQELRSEVVTVAVALAEKIVQRELNPKDSQDIIDSALEKLTLSNSQS